MSGELQMGQPPGYIAQAQGLQPPVVGSAASHWPWVVPTGPQRPISQHAMPAPQVFAPIGSHIAGGEQSTAPETQSPPVPVQTFTSAVSTQVLSFGSQSMHVSPQFLSAHGW